MDLDSLKKKYILLEKKYALPSFNKINENFEIEKIEKDSDFIVRAVRKAMIDKIVNSLNFLEMLINQFNAPRLYIPFLRTVGVQDKKVMDEIYSKLGNLSIMSLELEIESSEKQEAEAIKKIYETWNSLKPEFKKLLAKIKNPSMSSLTTRKEKSYFG